MISFCSLRVFTCRQRPADARTLLRQRPTYCKFPPEKNAGAFPMPGCEPRSVLSASLDCPPEKGIVEPCSYRHTLYRPADPWTIPRSGGFHRHYGCCSAVHLRDRITGERDSDALNFALICIQFMHSSLLEVFSFLLTGLPGDLVLTKSKT